MTAGYTSEERAGGGTLRRRMAQRQQRSGASATRKRETVAESGFVLGPRDETKQRLLAATVQHLEQNGVADVSLRQLAEQLGTSHRLLIYHFGTKEGLLVAVVDETERVQRDWLEDLWQRDLSPMELMRRS